MRNKIFMKNVYIALLIIFTFFVSFGYTQPISALTVSPAKLEISGDAGTTLAGDITLFNESNRTQTFYTSFENFEPSDDSGAPLFVGNDGGLATWISSTASITLEPQERTQVPFTITIPTDAEAGGYFSAIFFGTQPPAAEGGTVSIGGRIGILTLLRVNGDIPEAGGVLEFKTIDDAFFYDMPPVEFEYRFSNDGGDRVIPRGDIELKNTFGSVRDTLDANPIEGNVLPSSARRFNITWATEEYKPSGFFNRALSQWHNFHFGWYTAEMNLGWGYTNQTSVHTLSLLIIPWQLLILIVATLICVFFALKAFGKKYKQALLKQLEQENNAQEEIEEEN